MMAVDTKDASVEASFSQNLSTNMIEKRPTDVAAESVMLVKVIASE